MKNNENKTGRITNFYNRLQRKEDKINSSLNIVAILLTIAVYFTFVVLEVELFKYDETKYQYLETQVKKVIVDNRYIDMEQISDKKLYSTIMYNFEETLEEEWVSCQIKLYKVKDGSCVEASITKRDDGTLNMDVTYDLSKVDYYFAVVVGSIIAMIIIAFAWVITFKICYQIFLLIIRILQRIEKSLKLRKKV